MPERPATLTLRPVCLLCVGDVHGFWDDIDGEIVKRWAEIDGMVRPDAVVFVGDFANETPDVVRKVATDVREKAGQTLAAVLGNHDVWDTTLGDFAAMAEKHSATSGSPQEPAVQRRALPDGSPPFKASLECLGADHIGFGSKNLPVPGLSFVGARPYSWGGPDWQGPAGLPAAFYSEHCDGLASFEESASRIESAADGIAFEDLVLLSHNGPAGLGSERTAPCGKDFDPRGGDFGDPDLAMAIDHISSGTGAIRNGSRRIAAVLFGHMHERLKGEDGARAMAGRLANGIVCLNLAVVPRRRPAADGTGRQERAFTVVDLAPAESMAGFHVAKAETVWVGEDLCVTERILRWPVASRL